MPASPSHNPRKLPKQHRAQITVDAILEASAHILKEGGVKKFNTNAIAQKAGVSIGSLYQYFPNKDAILVSLADLNYQRKCEVIEESFRELLGAPIETIIRELNRVLVSLVREQHPVEEIFAEKLSFKERNKKYSSWDHYLIKLFKDQIHLYQDKVRMDNVELSLYLIIQSIKACVASAPFDEDLGKFDEDVLLEELFLLSKNFLLK